MSLSVDLAKVSLPTKKSGVNVKNLRYTKNGNLYQKTNKGKLAGAVGLGAVSVVSLLKNQKTVKDSLEVAAQEIAAFAKEQGTEIDVKELVSNMKITGAITGGIKTALFVLAGLALGAIADFTINKIRAHKADKDNIAIKHNVH